MAAAAKAHRRQCLQVDKRRASTATPAPGGAGRRPARGRLPRRRADRRRPACEGRARRKVVVEGTFQGKKFAQTFAVEVGERRRAGGARLGRGRRRVAAGAERPVAGGLVTAYCQQFNIASRAASFLVLENEADYKRFNLEEEKGKTLDGRPGQVPRRRLGGSWARRRRCKQAFGRLLYADRRAHEGADRRRRRPRRASCWRCSARRTSTCPPATVQGRDPQARRTPTGRTWTARKRTARASTPYLDEAQRRGNDGDVDGAVRVLSSVIEEHPGRGDALRLVGYRLLDLRSRRRRRGCSRGCSGSGRSSRTATATWRAAWRTPDATRWRRCCTRSCWPARWHSRFGDALKTVTREEYARHAARGGLRDGKLSQEQRRLLRRAPGRSWRRRAARRTCA